MDIFTIILAIIQFASAVFTIILFFKIWNMTSDVREILKVTKDRMPKPTFDIDENVMIEGKEGVWTVFAINDKTITCKHGRSELTVKPSMIHKI